MHVRLKYTVVFVLSVVFSLSSALAENADLESTLSNVKIAIDSNELARASTMLREARLAGIDKRHLARPNAMILLRKGKTEEARSLLASHLREERDDIAARALICEVFVQLRDTAALEEQVKIMMVQSRQTNYMMLYSQAQLLMMRGDWKQARAALLQARAVWPPSASRAMTSVLQADMALDDKFAAREHAEEMLEAAPQHPFANYVMGSLFIQKGEYERALKYLEVCLKGKPDVRALNDAAWALYSVSRLDDAEKRARQALALLPDLPAALDTLGMIMLAKGKPAEAEKMFRKSIENNRDNVTFYLHLAMAIEKQGRAEDARVLVKPMVEKMDQFSDEDIEKLRNLAKILNVSLPAE